MTDSGSKKASIPQWQQKAAQPAPSPEENAAAPAAPQRAALLDQASKFLQDDSISKESTEHKVAFLKTKGLSDDEIQSVLGASTSTDTPAAGTTATEDASQALSSSPTPSTDNNNGRHPDVAISSTSSPSPSPSSSSPSSQPSANRDIPPIITYPEFLFQPSKPPPLVSIRSVLYTIYSTAALGTGLYAASEYLVKPMLATLANARRELAESAHENLKTLNKKLEDNVSVIPLQLSLSSHHSKGDQEGEEEGDSDSITSDPTELWHRDAATQTSPDALSSSSTENLANTPPSTTDLAEKVKSHVQKIEAINSCLQDFLKSEKLSDSHEDAARNRITDMRSYLDGLAYSAPSYGATTGYGVFTSPGIDSFGGSSVGLPKSEEDAIFNFRSEIRGFKGAMLSARNFPSGGARRSGVGVSIGR